MKIRDDRRVLRVVPRETAPKRTTLRESVTRDSQTRGGVLYLVATLIGTVGIAVAFYDPIDAIVQRFKPSILVPITAFCLCLSFAMKVPYMVQKRAVLSQIVLSVWGDSRCTRRTTQPSTHYPCSDTKSFAHASDATSRHVMLPRPSVGSALACSSKRTMRFDPFAHARKSAVRPSSQRAFT